MISRGRKSGIEDFICKSCSYSLCSAEEYSRADSKQRSKYSTYWSLHNKTAKHKRLCSILPFQIEPTQEQTPVVNNPKEISKPVIENPSIPKTFDWNLLKTKWIRALNDIHLPRLDSFFKNCSWGYGILGRNEDLQYFFEQATSPAYTTNFGPGAPEECSHYINYINKAKIFQRCLYSLFLNKFVYFEYVTIGTRIDDIKLEFEDEEDIQEDIKDNTLENIQ